MSEVRIAIEGGVLGLTLDRAAKKNALTDAMYAALAQALEGADGDESVRVVLLEAEGDAFTAGNDIGGFLRASMTSGLAFGDLSVVRFLKALVRLKKPLVCAVQGDAIGVGTTMLLHADVVVAAEDARLMSPFVDLGLTPEAASSLTLPARIGHIRAFAMFALRDAVSGREAVALGLANEACAKGEVRARARAFADQLAAKPNGALVETKRLMRDAERMVGVMEAENAVFAARLTSAEAAQAFAAFMARSKPA